MLQPKYPLAKDTIDYEDKKALAEWILKDERLTMGRLTREFEEKWSNWVGRKYSVFCNSGSSANLLMFAALRDLPVGWSREAISVIVPSVGWVTSIAPAMQLQGYGEIFMCEADPNTFGLDLNCLEDLIQRRGPHI